MIGLFADKSVAPYVVDELINSGFPRSAVFRLEGNSGELERALLKAGTDAGDAGVYAGDLPHGGAFVSVRTRRAQIDRAVKIMNRYVRA